MLPQLRWSTGGVAMLWFLVLLVEFRIASANPCLFASTCTECIKASKECAWCTEPTYNGSIRCDSKTNLHSKCAHHHIFEPKTEVRVPRHNNLPLGKKQTDGQTITQLEPQQVQAKIKPGESVEIPFKYEHHRTAGIEVRDFQIMTSSYKNAGAEVEFSIDCNGERKQGTTCPGIQEGQRIDFFLKITLLECKAVAMSVSVYGYNTVSAVFVTPSCECECEKQHLHERRSPVCNHQGDLTCGQCKCENGKGGRTCECDLQQHGVSTAEQLENRCRAQPGSPVCSGKGACNCGRCQCDAPTISGDFCENNNDVSQCPTGAGGAVCSAQGECRNAKCDCQTGFSGDACECNDDPEPCTENGLVCSGNGQCSCGHCSCNDGFTGATCAVEQPADENVDILPADDDQSADATTVADAQGQTNAAAALLNVHVVLSALTLLLLAVLFR
ncbi:INB domain-containing protein [Aphelenchoides fujianensis]|nr:INB domain-containing protein [Aphelenchoides fujianensis]